MQRLDEYVGDAATTAAASKRNAYRLQECIDYALAMHRLILEQAGKTATHTEDDTPERLAAMEHIEQLMLKWLEPRKALEAAIKCAQQLDMVIERIDDFNDAVLDFRGSTSITARAAFEQMRRIRREGYEKDVVSIGELRRELRNRPIA